MSVRFPPCQYPIFDDFLNSSRILSTGGKSMNFDKQLDVFSRNLSEIRRNGATPTSHSLKSFGLGSPRFRPSKAETTILR